MINVEYLAITAIFTFGFYLGFKIKEAFIDFKTYLKENFGDEN